MPKTSMTFELPGTPWDRLAIARRFVVERGWVVQSHRGGGRLVTRSRCSRRHPAAAPDGGAMQP